MERLEYVLKAKQNGQMVEQVFCSFIGPRRARISSRTSPTSTCSSKTSKWTIVVGIVNDSL